VDLADPGSVVATVLVLVLCVVISAWIAGQGAGMVATITAIAFTWTDKLFMGLPVRLGLSLAVGGVLSLLVGQVHDIRRRAREAIAQLQSSEERFRRIVETADEGIWVFDASGVASYVNSRAAEMLGLTANEVIGRSLGDFTYTPSGAQDLAEALGPIAKGRPRRFDLRLRRANGSMLWARVSASPVPDENGSGKVGVLAMLVDVTDRVLTDEALHRSEARFRRLSDSGMIGVAVLDAEGRATEANDEFLRLVGGDRDDLLAGRLSLTARTPSEFQEQDRRKLKELSESGVCTPFVKDYLLKDGGRSAVLVGAARLLEGPVADGETVGIMLDVSARRRAEEAMRFLAEAGEVLGCSLDYDVTLIGVARLAVPRLADLCAVDVVTADGKVARVASAYHDRRIEVTTGPLPSIEHDLDDSPLAEVLGTGQAVVGRGPGTVEIDQKRQLTVSSFMVVPLAARGRTFGAISLWTTRPGRRRFDAEDLALAEDLARRAAVAVDNARLFAEAKLARVHAERADRTKNQFLAALSHELRTPLTPVLIDVTATLDSPGLPDDIRPVLELTRRNVELEARLIDDLLDVTRISQGKLRLNRSPVDAHTLIHQAVEICRADPASTGLTIQLELDAKFSLVDGDPARIQQILWNLIKNAVKFTPTGGQIIVRTRNELGPKWVVEVIDTGIGIEPEVLPRIFDAFEQGDASVTKQFGGLGLGLAISKSLAEAHGGRLVAASPGKHQGSTFSLVLPALAHSLSPDSPDATPDATPSDQSLNHSGLRILLAEDNADTLRVLSRLLRTRGHTVSAASGFEDALHIADSEGPFDLLISDIGLPDGSGLDLMSRLRLDRDTALTGIALSGFGTEDDLRKSREVGFATHLIKPIDFAALEDAIRRVTVGRH
jgi:PAS domain S-box-containing protein